MELLTYIFAALIYGIHLCLWTRAFYLALEYVIWLDKYKYPRQLQDAAASALAAYALRQIIDLVRYGENAAR